MRVIKHIGSHPPSGVELIGHTTDELRLSTTEGGAVAVDRFVADTWKAAIQGRDADALTVACLAVARLLDGEHQLPDHAAARSETGIASTAAVTAIVVVSSPRELQWLDACVASLRAQDPPLEEILLVDNASGAALAPFAGAPRCRVLALRRRLRLAAALNEAMRAAPGDFFLMLNPDVKLEPDATREMLARAAAMPRAAAVVPKTLFWRAPAFLNGIGNRVGGSNWGTDLFIGHLDLGQFDEVREAMSASLTVSLMSRRAVEDAGGFDEQFRAYYEDAEWAYRARMMGWTIAAAPRARAYHAFGGFWEPHGRALSRAKLASAVNGRLRFMMLLAERRHMRDVLRSYAREDAANIRYALRRADLPTLAGYAEGWAKTIVQLPSLRTRRRDLRGRRVLAEPALFDDDASAPPLLMRGSAPLLTREIIDQVYRPLVESGRTIIRTGTMPPTAAADRSSR